LHPVLVNPVKKFRPGHKISKTMPERVKGFSTEVNFLAHSEGESLYLSIL
jgi:hypothetical protein